MSCFSLLIQYVCSYCLVSFLLGDSKLEFFRAFLKKNIWNAGTWQSISSNFSSESSECSSILYLVILEGSEMTNGRLVALIFWRSNREASLLLSHPARNMDGSGFDDEKMVWTAEQVQKISVCWACYSPGCFCNWEATLYVWTANTCRLSQSNIAFAFSALVEHLHTDHQFIIAIIANRSVSVNPAMLRIWFDCHEVSGSTCHGWEIQTTKGGGGGCGWLWVIHDGEL